MDNGILVNVPVTELLQRDLSNMWPLLSQFKGLKGGFRPCSPIIINYNWIILNSKYINKAISVWIHAFRKDIKQKVFKTEQCEQLRVEKNIKLC